VSNRTFQNDVRIDSIICPAQVRGFFDEDAQALINMTVRQRGIRVPVTLRRQDGKLYLMDGARRVRAAIAAGQTTVPAIIEDGELAEADRIVEQVVMNCQREDLTGLEKAEAIANVIQLTGSSAAQIAAKLGFTGSTVSKLLSLLSLPESIKEGLRSGKLPVTAAYELSRVGDSESQEELAGQVAQGRLTRDALSSAIKAGKHSRAVRKRYGGLSRLTVKLADRRSVTVVAPKLDWCAFVTVLEELLKRAASARDDGLTLEAFLKRTPVHSTTLSVAGSTALQLAGAAVSASSPQEIKAAG
jgi:ParB/RepB/Spo0J family partition protein